MQFTISNSPVFSTLDLQLAPGETVRAEGGAMVSMSGNVQLAAKTAGKGLGGMLKAAIGGEGLMVSEFTADGGPGELILAPAAPGDVVHIPLSGGTIMAQGGAYLAGAPSLELSTQGSLKAMFSGEGLFLQKITGSGDVFLSSYGAVYVKELAQGERYSVDTGHMVAFEPTVSYELKKAAKGLFSTIASGEGLVCSFTGPGKVWIQTRNLRGFAQMLYKLMPTSSS